MESHKKNQRIDLSYRKAKRERETEKFKKVNKIDQIVQYSINTHLHFDCH